MNGLIFLAYIIPGVAAGVDQVGGLKEVHVEDKDMDKDKDKVKEKDKDKGVSRELGFEEILNNVISVTPATEQER